MSYLKFSDPISTGRTFIWKITAQRDSRTLGTVQWYAPWRKYVFSSSLCVIFDADCLRTIAQFCSDRTREHNNRLHPATHDDRADIEESHPFR